MINKIIWIIGIVWIGNIQNGVQAQRRNFIHPGITYIQGDLDPILHSIRKLSIGENKSEKDVLMLLSE